MAFNGSGTYTLPAGNPVVTGTTISSSTTNTTNSDIATALTNCITRDGQSTPSVNLPMNAKKLTGLAAGTSAGDSVRYEQVVLTSALGTNVATFLATPSSANLAAALTDETGSGAAVFATSPTLVTPALGTPSSGNLSSCTNAVGYGLKSATTTVSVSAATAPTAGQALVATSSTTATWQTPASAGLTLGTPVNTTSGVSIDYTGIPAGVKQITVNFVGVSVSGTSQIVIQIGDSGGIETSGYLVLMSRLAEGSTVSGTTSGDGFGLYSTSAAAILSGSIVLNLENSSSFTWVAQGAVGNTAALLAMAVTAGRKSLSAELDRVRITTSGGTDTFDAGQINISYQ